MGCHGKATIPTWVNKDSYSSIYFYTSSNKVLAYLVELMQRQIIRSYGLEYWCITIMILFYHGVFDSRISSGTMLLFLTNLLG